MAKGSIGDILGADLVDMFGKLSENPGNGSDPLGGWTADFPYVQTGDGVTTDHSMIRKPTVLAGVTNVPSFFDPLLEYDSIPPVIDVQGQTEGNWGTLGSHTCDCATAGIEEAVVAKVSIYPNPTKDGKILVEFPDFIQGNIRVMNIEGKLLRTIQIQGQKQEVWLPETKGIYLLEMNINGNTFTKKVRRE